VKVETPKGTPYGAGLPGRKDKILPEHRRYSKVMNKTGKL
jgi:hypothetical protein